VHLSLASGEGGEGVKYRVRGVHAQTGGKRVTSHVWWLKMRSDGIRNTTEDTF
jgi:hypothetical protein